MRILRRFLLIALVGVVCRAGFATGQANIKYLITDNDVTPPFANSVTVLTVGSDGTLSPKDTIETGGQGIGGGFFATQRVVALQDGNTPCAFATDAASGDIAGLNLQTLKITGNFRGSGADSGISNGIGLAANSKYLYASFTDSNRIGTFSVLSGCKLKFVGDVKVDGLRQGTINGMKVHSTDLLVVTYSDGSIESFNVTGGKPVSNDDEQDSSGRADSNFPTGVDVSSDGHWAIFGDVSNTTVIEVSDLSSGKLAKPVVYHLGVAVGAANVYLSPDETLLYITNTQGDRITAAKFDATTGKLSKGCVSGKLKGESKDWSYLVSLATASNSGTGGSVYVAEYGSASSVGIIKVTSSDGTCTLTETAKSPAEIPGAALMSITGFPARSF
ncbi:MAG TPA: beta-propeller fold lactonase family protein [Terriglobales bacterium]